jgi:hypothetical protein
MESHIMVFRLFGSNIAFHNPWHQEIFGDLKTNTMGYYINTTSTGQQLGRKKVQDLINDGAIIVTGNEFVLLIVVYLKQRDLFILNRSIMRSKNQMVEKEHG